MFGHRMKQKNRGFTIIELLTTIALLSIIAALAVPSFSSLIKSNRLTSATNELVSVINTARAEAIKRKVEVSVAPKGSSWDSGVVVKDADGVIYTGSEFPKGISASSTSDKPSLKFDANGYASNSQPWGNDGLKICTGEKKGRAIVLKRSGSLSVSDYEC